MLMRSSLGRIALAVSGSGWLLLVSAGVTAAEPASPAASSEVAAGEADQAADASTPLDELAWVIGDWTDQAESGRVHVECRWTKNGHFITRRFSVLDADQSPLLEGTQVIGWDPAAQSIRSWTFDSEGGFGEGVWSRDGNRWLIKANFTLVTGERASSLNLLTRLDENTATWSSVNREVAGELQPNQAEVTVVRVADATDAAQQEPSE